MLTGVCPQQVHHVARPKQRWMGRHSQSEGYPGLQKRLFQTRTLGLCLAAPGAFPNQGYALPSGNEIMTLIQMILYQNLLLHGFTH